MTARGETAGGPLGRRLLALAVGAALATAALSSLFAGCVATLTAARKGCRVALIQDRPDLGGNASKEIGLSPRGENGGMVAELSARTDDGDLVAVVDAVVAELKAGL